MALKSEYDVFIIATRIIVPVIFWGTVSSEIYCEQILAPCFENSSYEKKYGFCQQDRQCPYHHHSLTTFYDIFVAE
jgi:hypothetical protein